ncbi:L-fuculose-phosphate aldolase [Arcanobacterium pluranimalium]|uniref:class II aldolase/adducin family protein n=1 Tax=Arcanobacterium pluranimalium TaxID=108028 RepID=UPI00195C4DD0|nr:class II aldolase/adducin family protein [Arcanobacterium pluranimalium]MBM7824411.1 L-fuculose-phosphate aldolase [Arcanobacterium pluranimalium]
MSFEIQNNIIATSQKLLEKHLVARTWGNLSQRIDGETFYCTPSGRDYNDLVPEEMIKVRLDGSYDGDLKPTTERSLHALIYSERPDAQFIIHTHQPYASAMSLGNKPYPLPADLAQKIGSDSLPIANYGLPGQKKLHNAIMEVLRNTGAHAILMKAHGMIVFAPSADDALQLALDVEEFCRAEFAKRTSLVPDESITPKMWKRSDANIPSEAAHIFAKRDDVEVIYADDDPVVLNFKDKLVPYLDDFAQLVGLRMTDTPFANAVFGAETVYYLGKDASDAEAVRMVVHKNALAATMGRSFAAKPISFFDRILMNAVYRLKYSKLKDKKSV